jgi:hypothetical protein
MEHGQPHIGAPQPPIGGPQPFPMFTYVGPMPVMPLEKYDDDEDAPAKERMN